MKPVNKFLRALALVIVMCMVMAPAALAAETGKVWLSISQSENGKDTSALIVTDTTVTDGLVKVTYDPEVLTYKGVMVSSEYVAMHSVNAEEAGVVLISWVAPEAYEHDGSAITLIEVQFEGASEAVEANGLAHDAQGNALTIGTVDTSALEEALAEAEKLVEEDYTEESWAALEDAKKAAEDVLKDPTATQEEVDAAEEALKEAMEALEEIPVDKSKLEEALTEAEKLVEEDYTEESWAALEDAKKAAEEVLKDPTATQEEVDAAAEALKDAMEALEEIPVDKSELEKAIKSAKSKNKKDYTKKSYDAMKAALKVAEKVFADENATQEEVDAAADALNKAIKALVPNTGKNPGTGDEAQPVLVAAIAALALIGIGALVVLNKKNKKGGK